VLTIILRSWTWLRVTRLSWPLTVIPLPTAVTSTLRTTLRSAPARTITPDSAASRSSIPSTTLESPVTVTLEPHMPPVVLRITGAAPEPYAV
jgi:hypothetical protein